ncbi:MAG: mandelate racemase/muconate lactonizing enzyme family protein [Gammaproteobacteria bacterium]|nr:mandelate racemase/muconate lactonizing enzyme family protein [Gammaproteobacteria bacterium]
MHRRQFLNKLATKIVPISLASLMFPKLTLAQSDRPRITDIKVHRMRTLGETGIMESAWAPGRPYMRRIGGGSVTEILTDQGISGIAPGLSAIGINRMKQLLVGQDPFDNETLGHQMRYTNGAANNWRDVGCVEIALWDIVGKVAGQPLYKLWGAQKDKVPAYASMIQLSTPEERAEQAVRIKEAGWQGMKIRLHHLDMHEDIRTIQLVREAAGDDFTIMTDANQAQSSGIWQPGIQWDYKRALDTARALNDFDVYWLEEPLRRYDYEGLAELNRATDITLAGGENNQGVQEFVEILEKKVYDILQPEILVTEGVQGLRAVSALALAHHKLVIPHHGGGQLGTIAQLHMIGTWPHCPWVEIMNDPPISPYTNGFAIMENPPQVDSEGYMAMPQDPGLGVRINRDLIVNA